MTDQPEPDKTSPAASAESTADRGDASQRGQANRIPPSDVQDRWFPVFEPETPRIDDDFYQAKVTMYLSRAKYWRSVSIVCLLLTLVFVAVGIGIFMKGDPLDQQRAESEVNLTVELAELRRDMREVGTRGARILAHAGLVERANVLANAMGRLPETLSRLVMDPTESNLGNATSLARIAQDAMRAVTTVESQDEPPSEFTIDVSSVRPRDPKKFSSGSIEILRDHLLDQGLNIGATAERVDEVVEKLDALESSDISDATSDELQELSVGPILTKFNALSEDVGAAGTRAQQELEDWQQNAQIREEEQQSIQQSINDVESQLEEVRAQRDKILFMSWIPDLTVRVGAVVLLLFLTQILVATFRYTAGLSAFYLARADAIRLLQPAEEQPERYDVDFLGKLVQHLSPSSLGIDPVKAPTDNLTDIAKAWISRNR